MELSFNHTTIFYKHYHNNPHCDISQLNQHPFSLIEVLYEQEMGFLHYEFDSSFSIFQSIKDFNKKSYLVFEYEMFLLVSFQKLNYLNEVTSILIDSFKSLRQEIDREEFKTRVLEMKLNLTKESLRRIFLSYHFELNEKNRIYLSKWFYLKEPIKSFVFTKVQEEKRLKILFNKYLRGLFFRFDTSFDTFKCLFQGKYLNHKLNWVDKKSSLYYFIKLLNKHKVIKNTKNKHWVITSEFFLINSETVIPDDFVNQKETQNQNKREKIENFVNSLTI